MTAFRDSGRDGIAIVAFELLDAGEFREDEIEIALLGLNAPLNYAHHFHMKTSKNLWQLTSKQSPL